MKSLAGINLNSLHTLCSCITERPFYLTYLYNGGGCTCKKKAENKKIAKPKLKAEKKLPTVKLPKGKKAKIPKVKKPKIYVRKPLKPIPTEKLCKGCNTTKCINEYYAKGIYYETYCKKCSNKFKTTGYPKFEKPTSKICKGCNIELPLTEFYGKKYKKNKCKVCWASDLSNIYGLECHKNIMLYVIKI